MTTCKATKTCPECNGTGQTNIEIYDEDGLYGGTRRGADCRNCNGTGSVETTPISDMEKRLTYGYGREALADVFSRIQNPDDWKAPIEAMVPGELVNIVVAAIRFFTATDPVVEMKMTPRSIRYLITSEGYRNGPAGDH